MSLVDFCRFVEVRDLTKACMFLSDVSLSCLICCKISSRVPAPGLAGGRAGAAGGWCLCSSGVEPGRLLISGRLLMSLPISLR